MKNCSHNYKPANQDGSLYGDVRTEIREILGQRKWDDYLLLYCSKCGDTKKVYVREMKPE